MGNRFAAPAHSASNSGREWNIQRSYDRSEDTQRLPIAMGSYWPTRDTSDTDWHVAMRLVQAQWTDCATLENASRHRRRARCQPGCPAARGLEHQDRPPAAVWTQPVSAKRPPSALAHSKTFAARSVRPPIRPRPPLQKSSGQFCKCEAASGRAYASARTTSPTLIGPPTSTRAVIPPCPRMAA